MADIQTINDFTDFIGTVFFSETEHRIAWSIFFILSILECLSFELTVARIGSLFCKFECECSIAGI